MDKKKLAIIQRRLLSLLLLLILPIGYSATHGIFAWPELMLLTGMLAVYLGYLGVRYKYIIADMTGMWSSSFPEAQAFENREAVLFGALLVILGLTIFYFSLMSIF